MATVAVQVMAHPSREHLVESLLDKLNLTEDHVTWDRRNDRWDTGRRAWQAAVGRDAEWSVVIQDDALPCRDLISGLSQALDHVPARTIVSAYTGDAEGSTHPMQLAFRHAAAQADRDGATWLMTGKLQFGVTLALPSYTVREMLINGDTMRWPEYDRRIGLHFHGLGWRTWYTWPSLVEHFDGRSLTKHRDGRHALRFIGVDASALDVRWHDDVIPVQSDQFDRRRVR